jgi:hypothetical protein
VDRGLKTKANYHGLLFGVFAWAVEEHVLITVNPCAKTAPSRPTIKAEQPERTWLTQAEFKTFTDTFMASDSRDLLRVMVGTGLRFGEITALWVKTSTSPSAHSASARRGTAEAKMARLRSPSGSPSGSAPSTRYAGTISASQKRRSHGEPSPSRHQSRRSLAVR